MAEADAVVRRFLLAWAVSLLVFDVAAQEPAYHYEGVLVVSPDTGHIEATWRLEVRESEPQQRTFLLRDTLPSVTVGGDVAGSRVGQRDGMEGFTAIDVRLAPDAARPVVELSYAGVPMPQPLDNDINGISPGRVELNVDSFWFPIDARFTEQLTATLTVRVPGDGWQAVTTGEVHPVAGGFQLVNDDPRLDIAFTLSTDFRITHAEGFTVYDQRPRDAGVTELVAAAAFCRDFLNQRWGIQEPLPASRLLITNRQESGYARQNYIVFTDVSDTEPAKLTRFVCHEFAHQWASGGKFDTVDNWINEGFAEYLGMMAVRERLGRSAYDTLLDAMRDQVAGQDLPPIWIPGESGRRPYLVNYRKAPLALARLEAEIGEAAFLRFTQALLSQERKTTPSLLGTLEGAVGAEARATFEGFLAE